MVKSSTEHNSRVHLCHITSPCHRSLNYKMRLATVSTSSQPLNIKRHLQAHKPCILRQTLRPLQQEEANTGTPTCDMRPESKSYTPWRWHSGTPGHVSLLQPWEVLQHATTTDSPALQAVRPRDQTVLILLLALLPGPSQGDFQIWHLIWIMGIKFSPQGWDIT